MKRSGFTIVELVVVMTIMAILLGLGVFGMQKSQANAREAERKSDTDALIRGLEERYKNGNKIASAPDGSTSAGQYPSLNEILHIMGYSRSGWIPEQEEPYMDEVFAGISLATTISPDGGELLPVCVWACAPAGDVNQIMNGYARLAQRKGYAYEPVDKNGNLCCCRGCVTANIYYLNEQGTMIKVSTQQQ